MIPAVPKDLVELDQWVLWRHEKATKVPYQISGKLASSTDPQTWSSFEAVAAAWEKYPQRYAGLGFVFSPKDPYAGVDVDNCVTTEGEVKPWAQRIAALFADSYTEISPSRRGLKIWCRAHLPGPGKGGPCEDGGLELYDRSRYFTVTGWPLNDSPLQIEDHQADIERLYQTLLNLDHDGPAADFSPPPGSFDIETWIQKHKLQVRGPFRVSDPEVGGRKWIITSGCPFQPTYNGGSPTITQTGLGAVAYRCWCGDHPRKNWYDLRNLLEPGWRRGAQKPKAAPETPRPRIITMEELAKEEPEAKRCEAEHEPVSPPELLTQSFSDLGNVKRLIAVHGDRLRYCYPFRKWLVWDGRRWVVDEGDQVRAVAQETMLEFARQALAAGNEPAAKFAGSCLNSHRIGCALLEAQCHLAIKPDELDQHPALLNFLNATLDLKTGELRDQRREDFITKMVHHRYEPEAECPQFHKFLDRILNPPLIVWLQAALGYSLTGLTTEKSVFFCHGPSNTGKTTLLSTFLTLLAEYGALLQIDTLMTRQESSNTLADLADLRGARFAMTSETEKGQRLAEGKLKRITQGMGRIKTARKYENPIEFTETHKLWMDCNYKPVVRGTDSAIWSRLKPIPFEVVIPEEEIDRGLSKKFITEAEGILAWAVAGAVRWFKDGLGTPVEVERANRDWRAEMDQVGRFIKECCVVGELAQAKARPLYQGYKKWAEEGGEHWQSETAFGGRLGELDFQKDHTRTGTLYYGIGLKPEAER